MKPRDNIAYIGCKSRQLLCIEDDVVFMIYLNKFWLVSYDSVWYIFCGRSMLNCVGFFSFIVDVIFGWI